MSSRFTVTAITALCLVMGRGVAPAQQAFTSTTAPASVVKLSVLAAPGAPATIALRNGEMGRWTKSDGSQYGLTPVVADGAATLYVFEITPGKTPGTERLQQVAKLALAANKPAAYPQTGPLFEVTLLGTIPIPSKPTPPSSPDGPCTTCCVTCGDWTVCACAVQMDCGSCCCKEHCTCFDESLPAGGCAAPLAVSGSVLPPARIGAR